MIVHLKNVIVNMVASIYLLPVSVRRAILNWAGVSVGEETMVKGHCFFGSPGPITIGKRCYVSYDVDVDGTGPVAIGDDVYIAAGVSIGTCTHEIGPAHRRAGRQYADGVTIGSGSWIGMNTTLLPGVTIGAGCVVAAGAVVNEDCAPNGLYGGVPARLIRELDAKPRAVAVSPAA